MKIPEGSRSVIRSVRSEVSAAVGIGSYLIVFVRESVRSRVVRGMIRRADSRSPVYRITGRQHENFRHGADLRKRCRNAIRERSRRRNGVFETRRTLLGGNSQSYPLSISRKTHGRNGNAKISGIFPNHFSVIPIVDLFSVFAR